MAYGAPRRCAAHQYSTQQCELYEVSEIPAAVKVKQFIRTPYENHTFSKDTVRKHHYKVPNHVD